MLHLREVTAFWTTEYTRSIDVERLKQTSLFDICLHDFHTAFRGFGREELGMDITRYIVDDGNQA